MKIYVISLNASHGREISNFFIENRITNKYFYDYENLSLGYKSEDIEGVNSYFDYIYDDYDAFVEFPISFCFQHAYEKDSSSKFIYLNMDKLEWIEKMKDLFLKYPSPNIYVFEEFFCNHYIKTDKKKMLDLTDNELSQIYDAHLLAVDTFFENNENFLKLEGNDLQFLDKIKDFLNI